LIWPGWADLPVDETNEVLAAAFRIYEAGYRTPQEDFEP